MEGMNGSEKILQRAEQGDVEAQYAVGVAYQFGQDGAPRDPNLATKWLNAAAKGGKAEAYHILGARIFVVDDGYLYGSYDDGVRMMTKAAEMGCNAAQYLLGTLYFSGEYIPQNIDLAIKWLTCAAVSGHEDAQFKLGGIYKFDEWNVKDEAKSAYWMERAAEKGLADAQRLTAANYFRGTGVPQDAAKGKYWLEKAAENGDEKAIETLEMYFGRKRSDGDIIDQKLGIRRVENVERKVVTVLNDDKAREWAAYEAQWGWHVKNVEHADHPFSKDRRRITFVRNTNMAHYAEIRELEWQHRINEQKHTPTDDVTCSDMLSMKSGYIGPFVCGALILEVVPAFIALFSAEIGTVCALLVIAITGGVIYSRYKKNKALDKKINRWLDSVRLPSPEKKLNEAEMADLVLRAQMLMNG